jgi:hypothetical protein
MDESYEFRSVICINKQRLYTVKHNCVFDGVKLSKKAIPLQAWTGP